MTLSQMLYKIHKLIEAKELKVITQKEMATRLGVSKRAYMEWLRQTNEPMGMKAMLDMLNMLNDDDLIRAVRTWGYTRNNDKAE